MEPLHLTLLERLELGEIRRDELERFRADNDSGAQPDATVDQELMWILFSLEQLEKHRLRLVEHLRARRACA